MAQINSEGNILAHCRYCHGAQSVFEYAPKNREVGMVSVSSPSGALGGRDVQIQFRLFRCAGCGCGAYARIRLGGMESFPAKWMQLLEFHPDAKPALSLPKGIPEGIIEEFREAERCLESDCCRASAALFRSVLDKALRANGYKTKLLRDLKSQIDAAADEGVITKARQKRAHEEVRVLGNDVLHDEWQAMTAEDVELAHHYTQRILEDFYDDRPSVKSLLLAAGRSAHDMQPTVALDSSP